MPVRAGKLLTLDAELELVLPLDLEGRRRKLRSWGDNREVALVKCLSKQFASRVLGCERGKTPHDKERVSKARARVYQPAELTLPQALDLLLPLVLQRRLRIRPRQRRRLGHVVRLLNRPPHLRAHHLLQLASPDHPALPQRLDRVSQSLGRFWPESLFAQGDGDGGPPLLCLLDVLPGAHPALCRALVELVQLDGPALDFRLAVVQAGVEGEH